MAAFPSTTSTAPLSRPFWHTFPGLLVSGGLIALTLAGLGALIWQARQPDISELWNSPYLRNVIAFTLRQAVISTAISLALGLLVALALLRQSTFPGRKALLRIMELSLVLPTIVAVSGLVACYGREGTVTQWLGHWLSYEWNLYGINGIVLAHVFFNAPLAGRILLQSLESVPAPRRRVASQLGLRGWWHWRAVDWPAIRPVLPGVGALVFTLCFTSFAIIMTLGGGPGATTLEVAIYQALRFEFDFGQAAMLAVVQLIICGLLWVFMVRGDFSANLSPQRSFSGAIPRPDCGAIHRVTDRVLLLAFSLFLMLPLIAILARGLPSLAEVVFGDGKALQQLIAASLRSFSIALPAGVFSVATALAILGLGTIRIPALKRLANLTPAIPLMVPPIVLGTGLFLLLRPGLGEASQGLALVALINGLMALPFTLQLLKEPLRGLDRASLNLADQLGILGWYRWRWLHWPRMRAPLSLATAYGTGLSLGDFGVIALFGSPAQPTLPVLLYQQMGSYRVELAAATALWLVASLFLVFIGFNALGRSGTPSGTKQLSLERLAEMRHA